MLQAFELSHSRLDALLSDLVNNQSFYYSSTTFYFQDLYFTGCRSTELLQLERWKRVGNVYELTTLKTEAKRIIPEQLLSDAFKWALAYSLEPYDGLTYDQLTLELRKHILLHPIWAGKRIADTYLFRYNRARKLFDEKKNLLEVMDFFGWLSPTIATNYIHAPLIFDPFKKP